MSSYLCIETFFQCVRAGQLDVMENYIATTEGFATAREMAKTRNENGETPLLVAIAHSQFKTLKFLIEQLEAPIEQTGRFLWNGKEYLEMIPLLAATISNQHLLVDYLIVSEHYDSSVCLQSVMSSTLPRLEKIEALELLGSVYVLFYYVDKAFRYGIPCLTQALLLRQSTDNGQSAIPKIIHPLSDHVRETINNVVEIETIGQLGQIAGDYHQLIIQAFLISQRVLNRLVPGPHLYVLYSLHRYGIYRYYEDYQRAISIFLLVLEPFQPYQWESLDQETRNLVASTVHDMSLILRLLFIIDPTTEDAQGLTFANVMIALNFAFAHVAYEKKIIKQSPDLCVDWETDYFFNLILLACNMLPKSSQLQRLQFKTNLAEFIQIVEESGLSKRHLLHQAFNLSVVPTHLIEFLVDAGADPNAVDDENNTPLDILAKKNWNSVQKNIKAAEILINNGAHLDLLNGVNEKKTAQQLLLEKQKEYWDQTNEQSRSLHPVFNVVLPLSCQSAKVIQHNRLRIDEELPCCLHCIVRPH